VVVYDGPDPATWTKRGNYRVPTPCGVNCLYRSGGDLFIMTIAGLFSLSQAVETEFAQLMNQSISKGIRPLWRKAAKETTPARWQMVRRDAEGMAIAFPVKAGDGAPIMFPVNAETGKWALWDGWLPTCAAQLGDELLIGRADGRIGRGEATGADFGATYTCVAAVPFFSAEGRNIHVRMARAIVRSVETCAPKVAILKDYDPTEPQPPLVCISVFGDLWNTDKWNEGMWSGAPVARQNWQAVNGISSAVSVAVMYTFGQSAIPAVEILRVDLISEIGGVMT
jgi:hypothetical protein